TPSASTGCTNGSLFPLGGPRPKLPPTSAPDSPSTRPRQSATASSTRSPETSRPSARSETHATTRSTRGGLGLTVRSAFGPTLGRGILRSLAGALGGRRPGDAHGGSPRSFG